MPGFQKGQSGNPKGRRKAHLGCQKLRDLIGEHSEALIKRLLLSAVNDSDTAAAKLLIDRALPPLRPVDAPIVLNLPAGDSLTAQGQVILGALATGQLPVNQATAIIQALSGLARLHETDEILERLARAEQEIATIQRQPPAALPIGNQSADSPIGESPPEPQPPEPAPDSLARVLVELEQHESLSDVASALNLTLPELETRIADGLIEVQSPPDSSIQISWECP